jgi:hypothetical protein
MLIWRRKKRKEMICGSRAPSSLHREPLWPYASRHWAIVPCYHPLCLCHLPTPPSLPHVVTQGKEQRRREGRGANCKFHAMLATDSICHIISKGQMKGNGPTVNNLKSLWTQKLNIRVKRRGVWTYSEQRKKFTDLKINFYS